MLSSEFYFITFISVINVDILFRIVIQLEMIYVDSSIYQGFEASSRTQVLPVGPAFI